MDGAPAIIGRVFSAVGAFDGGFRSATNTVACHMSFRAFNAFRRVATIVLGMAVLLTSLTLWDDSLGVRGLHDDRGM